MNDPRYKINSIDQILIRKHIESFAYKPKISLITPVYNTKSTWISECIQSLQKQLYTNWELCLCDNGSTKQDTLDFFKTLELSNKIKLVRLDINDGISVGENAAVDIATGDYIGFLDSDDYLNPEALYLIIEALNKNRNLNYIYTDQAHVNANKEFINAYFKPDFSPHLICSQNYITHFSVYKGDLVRKLKLRKEYDGSQDYDLTLRAIDSVPYDTICHIPVAVYNFRRHENSEGTARESFAIDAAIRALRDYLQRLSRKAEVTYNYPWYRVRYLLDEYPEVGVILVSQNKDGLLFNCINRFLGATNYPNFVFYICISETRKQAIINRYGHFVATGKIKFIHRLESEEYSYSEFANRSVKECTSPILCLMNDDVEPISDNWLSEMVSYALLPEVGCVGAKLLYPNMTLQHAGVVLGVGGDTGVCNHVFKRQHYTLEAHWGKLKLVSNFAAVTGACSVMRKEVYEQVGGYEPALKVAFNDVDFCIKLIKAGYYNVLTPYALLIHYEAITRGIDNTKKQIARFASEIKYMKDKWGDLLQNDPFYNPNLSLESDTYTYATTSRYKWPWLKN